MQELDQIGDLRLFQPDWRQLIRRGNRSHTRRFIHDDKILGIEVGARWQHNLILVKVI